MKTGILVSLFAAVTLAPAQSSAQEIGGFAGIGIGHIEQKTGASLAGGLSAEAGRFRARATFGDLLFYQEEPEGPYRSEDIDGGRTICRNTSNGQFAADSNCRNTQVLWGSGLDASFVLTEDEDLSIDAGAGYRFFSGDGPYFALTIGPPTKEANWYGRAVVGGDAVSAVIGVRIRGPR